MSESRIGEFLPSRGELVDKTHAAESKFPLFCDGSTLERAGGGVAGCGDVGKWFQGQDWVWHRRDCGTAAYHLWFAHSGLSGHDTVADILSIIQLRRITLQLVGVNKLRLNRQCCQTCKEHNEIEGPCSVVFQRDYPDHK